MKRLGNKSSAICEDCIVLFSDITASLNFDVKHDVDVSKVLSTLFDTV